MRLIDADALDAKLKSTYRYFQIAGDISEAPTIDAVSVVRCRDCEHWKRCSVTMPDGGKANWGFCEINLDPDSDIDKTTAENDFCSFGKRKDNENGLY